MRAGGPQKIQPSPAALLPSRHGFGGLSSQPEVPGRDVVNRCVVANDDHVVTCFDATLENGSVMSAVEVFRVVDGKIAETWNSLPGSGAWG